MDSFIKKAYGYTRVSTDDQVTGSSLGSQKAKITAYAESNGIQIVDWFSDEGVSAKTANRPALKDMLKAIRTKKEVQAVIIYNLSRISRNVDSYSRDIGYELAANGVQLLSTTEPIDSTPTGKMLQTIFLAVHQLDNDTKSVTTIDNMKAVAKSGYWQSKIPYGFLAKKVGTGLVAKDGKEKKRTVLEPNLRDGLSDKVARLLTRYNVGDIKPAALVEYAKTIDLKTADGKELSLNSILNMLRGHVYAGLICNDHTNNEPVQGLHDGLISEEVFYENQNLLKGGTKAYNRSTSSDDQFPLKTVMLCGVCKKKVTASSPLTGGGKSHSPRYHCYKHEGGGSISPAVAHEQFVRLLAEITPEKGVLRLYREITKRVARKALTDVNKAIKGVHDELETIANKKQLILDKLIDGDVSPVEKDEYISKLNEQRMTAEDKLHELTEQQSINETTIEIVCNYMDKPAMMWQNADPALKQKFQQLVIPEGVEWDWNEQKFGTLGISPLYRYAPNKKDLSDEEKSLVVTPAGFEPAIFWMRTKYPNH